MIVYAQTDADIITVHRFLCIVAQPVLLAPINAKKSILEIERMVKDPAYGFVLMAINDERLIGTLGIINVDWWYANESFLTDRFFFVVEAFRNAGIGKALKDEAAAVARDLDIKLIINGKNRRSAKEIADVLR